MGQILSILWEILSILWEICYLIGIFRNHSSQQFWKVSPEIFFDNAGTIRKSRANFFPPSYFFPSRTRMLVGATPATNNDRSMTGLLEYSIQRPRKHFESGGALSKRGTFVYDQNQTILCRSRAERNLLKIWSLYDVGNGLQKGHFLSSKRGRSFKKYFFRSLNGAFQSRKRALFSLLVLIVL
jgi:hypothetical protein